MPPRSYRHSKWNRPIWTNFFLTLKAAVADGPMSNEFDTSFHSLRRVTSLKPALSRTAQYNLNRSNGDLDIFGRLRHCMLYSSQMVCKRSTNCLRSTSSPMSKSFVNTSVGTVPVVVVPTCCPRPDTLWPCFGLDARVELGLLNRVSSSWNDRSSTLDWWWLVACVGVWRLFDGEFSDSLGFVVFSPPPVSSSVVVGGDWWWWWWSGSIDVDVAWNKSVELGVRLICEFSTGPVVAVYDCLEWVALGFVRAMGDTGDAGSVVCWLLLLYMCCWWCPTCRLFRLSTRSKTIGSNKKIIAHYVLSIQNRPIDVLCCVWLKFVIDWPLDTEWCCWLMACETGVGDNTAVWFVFADGDGGGSIEYPWTFGVVFKLIIVQLVFGFVNIDYRNAWPFGRFSGIKSRILMKYGNNKKQTKNNSLSDQSSRN